MPEQLRNLAKLLREKAAAAQEAKDVKCAQVLQASVGLKILSGKLGL